MKANQYSDLNIGTFNVRGLNNEAKQNDIEIDFDRYKLGVVCLQETKVKQGEDRKTTHGHRVILFESESRHYGNGFIIQKQLEPSIKRAWKVSDRICVIQLDLQHLLNFGDQKQGRVKFITIINVYAPTQKLTNTRPEETDKFYTDLQAVYDNTTNNTLVILAGDFNAKVGHKNEGEESLGRHSKGTRNENGDRLVEFCESNNLFITNTAFNKASRYITTWVGTRKDENGKSIPIYNQIDYIICKQSHKHLLTDAQSYAGTRTFSDHKLVKTKFRITQHNIWKPGQRVTSIGPRRDRSQLRLDDECQARYRHQLSETLQQNNENKSASDKWQFIKSAINQSVEENVQAIPPKRQYQLWDKGIDQLSEKQKDLRIKIQNCKDEKNVLKLKKERNYILHKIRKRTIEVKNQYLDQLVENIDKSTSDGGMFKAVKVLNKKKFENPKVQDAEGKIAINPNDINKIVKEHFETKFRDDKVCDVEPFLGQSKPLITPISPTEVRASINKLNNGKAPGEDGICNEYLKYAPVEIDVQIADILNKIFEENEDIGINKGLLIPLPKPGKPKGPPQNLRPITLLNSIRKILSSIVLTRIRPKVENYLPHSQSGFRPDRSTADVVWAHRWMTAKAQQSPDVEIKITGIDMSAAFDTINRTELIEILKEFIHEDEVRIINYLLSETTISVKIEGATENEPFKSNIGTPQGDSLSPVLFIIYLEHALKDIRNTSDDEEDQIDYSDMPNEIAYADDIDFIGKTYADIDEIEQLLKDHSLKVNVDKTELTTVKRDENEWKTSKKVGSLLGSKEDIEHRKHLSNLALNKLTKIWKRHNKVKMNTKIKIYTSLVKSILLYNCGTWALTKTEENKLDAFHRRQLRRILNIHYPTIITNASLYKKCKETPLSTQILEARWKLFGHILRRDRQIPANKAMTYYFSHNTRRTKGRPVTTLPITLNNDLKLLNEHGGLTTITELEQFRAKAQDRKMWFAFTNKLMKTAEASKSDDIDGARQ